MFCLNNTSKPTPLDDNKPERQLPNGITLDRYNSVIKTLAAQLGIIPIILVIIGINILFPWTILVSLSVSII